MLFCIQSSNTVELDELHSYIVFSELEFKPHVFSAIAVRAKVNFVHFLIT